MTDKRRHQRGFEPRSAGMDERPKLLLPEADSLPIVQTVL